MIDVLVRTQKVFQQYESMCTAMRLKQKSMEKELKDAKVEISSLSKKLSLRRSREL